MRKIEICRKSLRPENSETIRLTYFITVDEMRFPMDGTVFESYGVGVRLEPDEEKLVRCITMESEKIERLIDFLAANDVCPVSLMDVIDDMLGVSGLLY